MSKKTVVGVAIVVVVTVAALYLNRKLDPFRVALPNLPRPPQVITVDQNWSEQQREQFHYTPQGTMLMPVRWFRALEQPCFSPFGCGSFTDPKYLSRFGFIPGKKEGDLPIGFAVDKDFVNPLGGPAEPVVGFTCAACHTGELYYDKYALQVEGAPAMIDVAAFQKALGFALVFNTKFPFSLWRYGRFERAVLGAEASAKDRADLKQQVESFVESALRLKKVTDAGKFYDNSAGFIRTDALARIGNQVFAVDMNNDANFKPANAPVRFPQIWDASWFNWVQYNSSIADPLSRNIGEALGVRALAKLSGPDAAKFENSVNMAGLGTVEKLLAGPGPLQGLASPKWPSVFPPLDTKKVSAGAELYTEHCQKCHLPPRQELLEDLRQAGIDKNHTPRYWWRSAGGGWFLYMKDVPIEDVGTDPYQARYFNSRKADAGSLGKGVVSAAVGLDLVTRGIADRFFRIGNIAPAEQVAWMGGRGTNEPRVRDDLIYKARPLNGIWAVAPYLHNGSVLSLDALLSSDDEDRLKMFWMGDKQFDPIKVGYAGTKFEGASEFDTKIDGNSNAGHRFKNGPLGNGTIGRALSPTERAQIIEYLKSI